LKGCDFLVITRHNYGAEYQGSYQSPEGHLEVF